MRLQFSLFTLAIAALHFSAPLATRVASVPLTASFICSFTAALHAGSTHPFVLVTRRDVGVGRVEWMPVLAVCLPSVTGGQPDAAQDVFPERDGLHVQRIHAWSVPAAVVDSEAVRDWANQGLVREAMRHNLNSMALSATHVVLPISTRLEGRTVPDPATRIGVDRELRQEAGREFAQIHLATFAPRQEADSHLNNSRLGKAQSLRQMRDEFETLGTEAETGGVFHRRKVATTALQVKPSKLEV